MRTPDLLDIFERQGMQTGIGAACADITYQVVCYDKPRTDRPPLASASHARKPRNLEKSRREILDAAFLEVYQHGFQGVSVDDIVRKTSHTKGAFYYHFPTKLDVGYAIVDDILKPMIVERWIVPLEAYNNPLEGIAKQMQRLIGNADPCVLRTGCPLNNLVQEMAPIDAGFRDRLRAALALWVDGVALHLKRGQQAGFVRRDVNAGHAAQFIVLMHEGTYGMLKGVGDPRAFRPLFASARQYLESIATAH
jgi:TetR/AcrR family transcriptional regulator, transcriptional repressor for nem operon